MADDPLKQHSPSDFATLTAPGTTPVLTSIFQCSAEFLGQLKLHLEQNPPSIPITSILGFQQFTAQTATKIADNESTGSTTYTDLTTAGPSITGLPDGKYIIFFGAYARNSSNADAARMSIQVNATTASDGDEAAWNTTDASPGSTACLKTLAGGGNNTITAKYRTGSGLTGFFAERWMIAIRYANL